MKSIYKIFLLALGVYRYAFSQITEITRLPVQDISQSNQTVLSKVKRIVSTSILFFMVLTIQVFAQLETIKEFPRAYESQEIWDLTPVLISNNEILVFYKNTTKDTIFSRRTTNSGQSWSNQKFEKAGEGINSFYYDMCLFKTSTGRLLFFYVSADFEIR